MVRMPYVPVSVVPPLATGVKLSDPNFAWLTPVALMSLLRTLPVYVASSASDFESALTLKGMKVRPLFRSCALCLPRAKTLCVRSFYSHCHDSPIHISTCLRGCSTFGVILRHH